MDKSDFAHLNRELVGYGDLFEEICDKCSEGIVISIAAFC